VLIILILLLMIGYAVRALDGGTRSGSWPAGPRIGPPHQATASADPASRQPAQTAQPAQNAQTAQDGGRLAAKAAMPSCACSLAK